MLTAVNIKGVFNISNETKYEKQAPDGMSVLIQFNLLTFILLLLGDVYYLCSSTIFEWFLWLSGISIDFNFYKTFWSLQVSKSCCSGLCCRTYNSKSRLRVTSLLLLAALLIAILGGTALKQDACLSPHWFFRIYEKCILMAIPLTSSCLQK